jgi:hypothetical protein
MPCHKSVHLPTGGSTLEAIFLKLCRDNNCLTVKEKEKLFDELADKTKNSRVGTVISRDFDDPTQPVEAQNWKTALLSVRKLKQL